MSTVYLMRFPNGAEYVGATLNFVARRGGHLRHLRGGTHESKRLQAAFDAHGAPEVTPIASALRPAELHLVEQRIIEERAPELNGHRPHLTPAWADAHHRTIKMPLPDRMVTAAGKTLALKAWAREQRIHIGTIRRRLDVLGWTPEEAVGLAPEPQHRLSAQGRPPIRLTHAGQTRTLKEWAEVTGIERAALYQRMRAGWTAAQIVGAEPTPIRGIHTLTR